MSLLCVGQGAIEKLSENASMTLSKDVKDLRECEGAITKIGSHVLIINKIDLRAQSVMHLSRDTDHTCQSAAR